MSRVPAVAGIAAGRGRSSRTVVRHADLVLARSARRAAPWRRPGGRTRGRTRRGRPGGARARYGDPDRRPLRGVDDEVQLGGRPLAVSATATLEGWFFWEDGIALMRDHTSRRLDPRLPERRPVAYRAGGTQVATGWRGASVRDGWHHGADGVRRRDDLAPRRRAGRHAGAGRARRPRRCRGTSWATARGPQRTRGRADEVAIYGRALRGDVLVHLGAGRPGRHDSARRRRRASRPPARSSAWSSTGRTAPSPTSTATTCTARPRRPDPSARQRLARDGIALRGHRA